MTFPTNSHKRAPWRAHLHEVIFEADTSAGKAFDILLIVSYQYPRRGRVTTLHNRFNSSTGITRVNPMADILST